MECFTGEIGIYKKNQMENLELKNKNMKLN